MEAVIGVQPARVMKLQSPPLYAMHEALPGKA